MTDVSRAFAACRKSIQLLFEAYSPRDVAVALFVSSTWLGNIGSPVKHSWLMTVLLAIPREAFRRELNIATYLDLAKFLEETYRICPEFPEAEDYVPAPDWGQMAFPLNGARYKFLFGGEFESPYDLLTAFLMVFEPLDSQFKDQLGRSPVLELESTLRLQDSLIGGITAQPREADVSAEPGGLSMPPELFWSASVGYLNTVDFTALTDAAFVSAFSGSPGSIPRKALARAAFTRLLFRGGLPSCHFLADGEAVIPLLPRRHIANLIECWARLLRAKQKTILPDRSVAATELGRRFSEFVGSRLPRRQVLMNASATLEDGTPHAAVFPAVLLTRKSVILFFVLPIVTDQARFGRTLRQHLGALQQAMTCLRRRPLRLFLRSRNEVLEHRSSKESDAPHLKLFIVLPMPAPEAVWFEAPQKLPGAVIRLEEILSVIDEVTSAEDFDGISEFEAEIGKSMQVPHLTLLDRLAAFRDTDGILVDGATAFTMIMLDPHWGSLYRFKSLSDFWAALPVQGALPEPRAWVLKSQWPGLTRLISRSGASVLLVSVVGACEVLGTAPFDILTEDESQLAEFLMGCVLDAIYRARDSLLGCRPFCEAKSLIVAVIAAEALRDGRLPEIETVTIPDGLAWLVQARVSEAGDAVVRVFFEAERVRDLFSEPRDRRSEVALASAVLKNLHRVYGDNHLAGAIEALQVASGDRPRFRLSQGPKLVAFPDDLSPWKPTPGDYKRARKQLAVLAEKVGVRPGDYQLEEAKTALNALRKAMVGEVDSIVKGMASSGSLRLWIAHADGLTHEWSQDRALIRLSAEDDVEYDRVGRLERGESEHTRLHRDYRYLIEKGLQHQQAESAVASKEETCRLLALIDWLRVIYSASDTAHYEVDAVGVRIDDEYRLTVDLGAETSRRQAEFGRELAEASLRDAGRRVEKEDRDTDAQETWIARVDEAFGRELGFRLSSVDGVLEVLSKWPYFGEGRRESGCYEAVETEIREVVADAGVAVREEELPRVLEFLSLKRDELLKVTNRAGETDDLPVWEHKKRSARYTIRPLINVDSRFIWGAYSVSRARMLWWRAVTEGVLPVDMGGEPLRDLLDERKQFLDRDLEQQAFRTVTELTRCVKVRARLDRLDRAGGHPTELGDYDVLAYWPEKHVILNVECKNLQPVYCMKDTKTLRDAVFGEGDDDEGHFRKIRRRQRYLEDEWKRVLRGLGWEPATAGDPTVRCLYVTRLQYWWTRFPPKQLDVVFTTLSSLADTLKAL